MATEVRPATPGVSDSESVVVCVHVRPLIDLEHEQGCRECLEVTPGQSQVGSGPHRFTYDHVFGGDFGQEPESLYGRCVAPLVDGLFKGYNATVFAYGQTGSGKTYTMGSAFPQEENTHYRGVIPQAMEAIFSRISEIQGSEFTIRVGFVEIHKEEIRDLLAKRQNSNVLIRELPAGGIVLAGTVEKEVRTQQEMIRVLEEGTSLRATAATGMNKTSSRSHAIFTITVEQRKTRADRPDSPAAKSSDNEDDEEEEDDLGLDDYLCAKMHLVDLAGSERIKRTKAQGQRLQEGININKGLLALGNVINALSEGKGHVPYRDSKLTRMLQDSLGGNSRTVMIACVSPADVNLEESLNTLRYSNRARAIKNKPMVNRDPVAAQIAALRQQLAAAKAENLELRRKLGMSPTDEMELLTDDGSSEELARALRDSETRVAALQRELLETRAEAELLREELKGATEAQLIASLQRDKVASALAAAAGQEAAAAALEEAGVPPGEATTERVLTNKVHELEDELRKLRISRIRSVGGGGGAAGTPGSPSLSASPLSPGAMSGGGIMSPFSPMFSNGGTGTEEGDDVELIAEEQAHRATMARVQSEMDILQQQLESKEAAIAAVSNHSTMKATYETQLREIAAERDALATERADLLAKLLALQAASSEERIRMERTYKERIRQLDTKVKGVDHKERKIRDLEGAKRRAMDSVSTLQTDVQRIKEQKAVLQRQAMQAAKEFNVWKKEQTKEVMHLKKEKRANAAQLMRMEALHSKQLEVLRRKTEEAAAARKRLQLLEGRRGARSKNSGAPEGSTSTGRPRSGSLGGTGIITGPRPADSGSEATFNVVSSAAGSGNAAGANATNPAVLAAAMADETTRREWVESELDICCSSYELQKVLEGEKAMRSEAARQLREVERRLAALKNPQWWGSSTTGAASEREGGEDVLLKKRARLASSAEKHGRQIQEVQLALVQARAREEERGGGAADPTRWSSIAASNEVRTMLTTVFRSASQYKSQAYEAQLAMTEMSEEVEMLRLKLEVSEAEKLEAAMQAAEAQATAEALAASQQGGHPTTDDESRQPVSIVSDANDVAAANVLKELEDLSEGQQQQQQVNNNDEVDFYEDEDDEEEEEEETSDEEGIDTWDPSIATPIVGKAKKKSNTAAAAPPSPPSLAEIAALEHLNSARVTRGEPPVPKLTVPELRAALKGTTVRGQEWKAGNKKKKEMLQDYFALMREQAGVQTTGGGGGDLSINPNTSNTTSNTSTSLVDTASTTTSAQQHASASSGRKSPFAAFRKLASRGSRKSNTSASSAPPKNTMGGHIPSLGGVDTMAVRQLATHVATYDDDDDDVLEIAVPIATTETASEEGSNIAIKQMKLGKRPSTQHDGGGGGGQTLSGASVDSNGSKASREPSRPAWVPSAR